MSPVVGEKYESMFPTIGFCVRWIFRIIWFQIETKRIFSLVGVLISLKRCLQS
jgi:hypothetical protein